MPSSRPCIMGVSGNGWRDSFQPYPARYVALGTLTYMKLTSYLIPTLLLVSSALIAACDFTAARNAFDEFNIVLGIENQKTAVVVQLFDARTGEFIERPATVEFVGDPALFVDTFGDPLSRIRTSIGQAGFSISDAKMPTQANPTAFDIRITAEGYLPLTQPVVVPDTGAYVFAFTLIDPSAPPEGVVTSSETAQTNVQGQTASRVIVAPPPSATTSAVRAEIPAGSTFLNAQGQPVSGSVSIGITALDPTLGTTLASLPRSRAALRKANEVNIEDRLIYGAFSVNLTSNTGSPVNTVRAPSGQQIELEVSLQAPLLDAETGEPLPLGSTITVAAFNPSTGTYEITGTATYTSGNPTGKSTQSNSLRISQSTSLSATSIIFISNIAYTYENVDVIINTNGHRDITATFTQPNAIGTGYWAPQNPPSTLNLRISFPLMGATGRVITVTSSSTRREQRGRAQSYTFDLPSLNPNISYIINLQCPPNKGVFLSSIPSLNLSYREKNTSTWFNLGDISKNRDLFIRREDFTNNPTSRIVSLNFMTNSLLQGRTYEFKGVYNGNEEFTGEYLINSNPFTLNWDVSSLCR